MRTATRIELVVLIRIFLPSYSPEQVAKAVSQPAAAVQARQSAESELWAHWVRHLSRPHWTTAPQQSAHPWVIPRSSFMHVAVQVAPPRHLRPHSATLAESSLRPF